ncbi:MAG: hypothetical protein NVSMB13_12170 [Mycobacteriales bacterium]
MRRALRAWRSRSVSVRAMATGAVIAAVAHVPVIPEHLRDAPYMGVLFVLLSGTCLALAGAVWAGRGRAVAATAAAVCGAAVLGYLASRLVAFPMLADDVGNWLEPLGVVSVLSELLVVGSALQQYRRPVLSA